MVVIKKEVCGYASQIFRDGLGKNECAAEGGGLEHRPLKLTKETTRFEN